MTVKENVLYSKNLTKLIYYPNGVKRLSFNILNDVKIIETKSLINNQIEYISISDSVKEIQEKSFYSNRNIK